MGDFINTGELKVGDIFRAVGHMGATGRPRVVTAIRQLRTVETYTVVESTDGLGRIGQHQVRDGITVERLAPITYVEARDALSLMAHGDVLYFVNFDGRLYA